MKIGLIDVDGHNFPNIALMKISAYHKTLGDDVEWWSGWNYYDRVYMSKVFDNSYTSDCFEPANTKELIKGGTGYKCEKPLSDEIEHIYPDYGIYSELTFDTAYGFLTRGCPNSCPFCIVTGKEGRISRKVADLSEWWNGQKNIVLCDPNLLACKDHIDLLRQLAESKAWVDMNQGVDARLLNRQNIEALNNIKISRIHFAWDLMERSKEVIAGLALYNQFGKIRDMRRRRVYVLTNFNTTMEENLYRIYTLRNMKFDPYVMVYDKPNASREIRDLQRWCNGKQIFKSCPDFSDYKPRKDKKHEQVNQQYQIANL